ncbi:MAG: ParA family protein [Salinispira sp.]
MVRIIAFANQKGGVGKTTSVVNLGAYLAEEGKRVLLVDFDPQCNLSSSVGADTAGETVYQLIASHADAKNCIQRTIIKTMNIIPSSPDLAGAAIELAEQEDREYYLQNALKPLHKDYDFILIDCPPSLGILTLNGLTAAWEVFIPLQTEYFALEGITQLIKNINIIQKSSNQNLKISGIIFTMYDSRTRLAQDVVKEVVGYFGSLVFKTIIPRNVRLSEAPSHSVPIGNYAPSSSGAKSYRDLAREVISRG